MQSRYHGNTSLSPNLPPAPNSSHFVISHPFPSPPVCVRYRGTMLTTTLNPSAVPFTSGRFRSYTDLKSPSSSPSVSTSDSEDRPSTAATTRTSESITKATGKVRLDSNVPEFIPRSRSLLFHGPAHLSPSDNTGDDQGSDGHFSSGFSSVPSQTSPTSKNSYDLLLSMKYFSPFPPTSLSSVRRPDTGIE